LGSVAVKIPSDILVNFNPEKIGDNMKFYLAIHLFKDGVLSLGKASKLAGMPLYEFMIKVSREGIDVLRYSPSELREELESLEKR